MKKRLISLVLTLCMLVSCVTVANFSAMAVTVDKGAVSAEVSTSKVSANSYGLTDTCQEGVILHCWNWSFNNIKNNMKTIAECGYTSIQTSPIQVAKEDTKGRGVGNWWALYQPGGFTIDNTGGSALGNKSEFKAMCDEAHKYGIHVIVDIVANHLGNKSNWQDLCGRAYQYEPEIANNWLFHNEGSCHDGSAYNVTKGQIGMPDLRTEDSRVQQRVLSLLKECIDCGADGFRFDAAKHIETPDDGDQGSQFWPTVINGAKSYYNSKGYYDELYNYGEILNTCGGGRSYGSYTKYMSITDNTTGNDIRGAVSGGNAGGAAKSNYNSGSSADKVVLWAESHDTYSNDSKESTYVSESNINKTWALVGSRNQASALYFARSQGFCSGTMGNIENYQWKSKEVAEVNKFHNYFNGQSEYLGSSGSIAYNERGTSGVVLVNCSGGSQQVNVKLNKMKDGTYTDQVSGNTFTVSGGQISGQIGSTGIAVVYNAKPAGPSASATPGSQNYKTDTITVTLKYDNATSGQYSIDNGTFQSFTNGQQITIGSGLAYDTVTTLKVKASNGSETSDVETYTYTKVDPSKCTTVYFDNTSYNWSTVYAYVYSSDGLENNGEWPGVQMQKDSSTGYYYYEVPENLVNGLVIFTESYSTSNRYPADQEPGMEINDTSMIFKANYNWTPYCPVPTSTTKATTAQSGYYYGDVDKSGIINIIDVTLIQKHIATLSTLSSANQSLADTNNDGKINIKDATNIQKYLIGVTTLIGKVGQLVNLVTPTSPTTATTKATTAPTTAKPQSVVTIYFEAGDWQGVPVARCFESDYNNHKDYTMTLVDGTYYKATVDSSYKKVEFRSGDGSTWTQWHDIVDGNKYSK